MGFLQGKKILVTGLLSHRSIAYGIAAACHREGAELAFTYQNERFHDRVTEMAREFGSRRWCCPATSPATTRSPRCSPRSGKRWDGLDGCVHSIAYAPREAIAGDLSRRPLARGLPHRARRQSSYSFPALAKAALPLMEGRNAALLTLTYLGAERTVPNYNVMGLAKASLEAGVRYMAPSLGPQGIRVNGISAGPIKTLAAARHRAASARCSSSSRSTRRCGATSPSRKSATPLRSCCPTSPAASPAKSPTSTAASTPVVAGMAGTDGGGAA